MPNYIANVTVPAPVIQFKNDLYLTDGQYDPHTLNIPCGINALVDDIQHYFVPVKDFGIFQYCSIVPAIGLYPVGTPPTPDSLLVLRVRDKYNRDYVWWVACTIAQYYASCQTCCGSAFVPIPEPITPVVIPCTQICANTAGNFITVFGAPADVGTYWAYGYFNGAVLPTKTAATLAALVTALNASWSAVGTPARNFVWSSPAAGVLQAVGGIDGDSLCVLVLSIAPSP